MVVQLTCSLNSFKLNYKRKIKTCFVYHLLIIRVLIVNMGTDFASGLFKYASVICTHVLYTRISIGRKKPVGLNTTVLYEIDSLHS